MSLGDQKHIDTTVNESEPPRWRNACLVDRQLLAARHSCGTTGLAPAVDEVLVSDSLVEGGFQPDGESVGVFDDVLPSAVDQAALGLTEHGDHNPDDLRSYEVIPDPDEDPARDTDAGGPTPGRRREIAVSTACEPVQLTILTTPAAVAALPTLRWGWTVRRP